MSRPRVVVAVLAVALAAAAALVFSGPLTRERQPVTMTATPPPIAESTLIPVPAGEQLCTSPVLLGPRSEVAQLVLDQGRKPAPPLIVTTRAEGHRSAPARVPGGTAQQFDHHDVVEAEPAQAGAGDEALAHARLAVVAEAGQRDRGTVGVPVDQPVEACARRQRAARPDHELGHC